MEHYLYPPPPCMPSCMHTDKAFFIKQIGEAWVISRILCQMNAMDWMTWIGYLALKVNGVTSQNAYPTPTNMASPVSIRQSWFLFGKYAGWMLNRLPTVPTCTRGFRQYTQANATDLQYFGRGSSSSNFELMTLRLILTELVFLARNITNRICAIEGYEKVQFHSSLLSLEQSYFLLRAETVTFTFMTVVWEGWFLGKSTSFAAWLVFVVTNRLQEFKFGTSPPPPKKKIARSQITAR
jgi:hypothetical protein